MNDCLILDKPCLFSFVRSAPIIRSVLILMMEKVLNDNRHNQRSFHVAGQPFSGPDNTAAPGVRVLAEPEWRNINMYDMSA